MPAATRGCTVRSALSLLLLVSLCSLPSVVLARHASSTEAGEESGGVYEIDRRSHPALANGWTAFLRADWNDPALAALPGLAGATLLDAEPDRALVWLGGAQKAALEADGVRLNRPRPRPPETLRSIPPEAPEGAESLTLWQSLASAVNSDRMMAHLDAISTVLQTRYYNTAGMQTATQYVLDRFTEYGLDNAYFDTFTYNGYTIRNVVGVKTGALYPSRIYLICGHLDSTSPQAQTLAPGAEDNGSGSVGVLEAARLLGPLATQSTIYFICFTAEEQGLIGSAHLAQIADQQNWDLRGVLNMDMIGYDRAGAPDLWIEGFPGNPGSVALMNQLETVANTYTDMAVYRYPNNGWGSDHVPFNDHGFPALLAIDYDWDNYSCYHQTCDVVANIVPTQLRRMEVAVTVTGAQLAGLNAALGSVEGSADRTDSGDDAGILIEILGTGYSSASTGPGGAFDLPDLLPGSYTLRASAEGYEPAEAEVTVIGGQATQVTIPLDPLQPSSIRGIVSLEGGGDPTGARVFVEGQQSYALAGPLGDYLLSPVYPGRVVVSADYPTRMPVASTLDIPGGQEVTGVNFTLKTTWNFEDASEGLAANAGWAWGTDTQSGAHSGTKVWGTKLGTNYDNCADYRLDLPPLDLRFYETARLHFWHWYKTEATYDGGNIQISTDAGVTWTVVTPAGGYPDNLQGSCNPLAGQPGYGGSQTSWTEAIVDLASYAGRSIRVRFWFGSDGGVRDRGWYLDDMSLEGTMQPASVSENLTDRSFLLRGLAVQPNPFTLRANVRFEIGSPAPTWVTVFDGSGRRIRSLVENSLLAGPQSISWDGLDQSGRRVPAGVYWVRVFTNGRTLVERLTLVR